MVLAFCSVSFAVFIPVGWICYAEKTHGSYILPYIRCCFDYISHTLDAPSFDAGVLWCVVVCCVVLCCVVLCCVVVLALVSTQTPCHNHML